MRRRFVLSLSVLSLLIGVMLMAGWIHGQWRSDWFRWQGADQKANTFRSVQLWCTTSGINLLWFRYDFEVPGKAFAFEQRCSNGYEYHISPSRSSNPFAATGSFFNRLGFGCRLGAMIHEDAVDAGDFIPSDGAHSFRNSGAHLPYWALVPAFLGAGLPSVRAFIARRRRLRRLAAGCCRSCGYDLRATPDRCPECGTVPDGGAH